jgi:hypothetical protein
MLSYLVSFQAEQSVFEPSTTKQERVMKKIVLVSLVALVSGCAGTAAHVVPASAVEPDPAIAAENQLLRDVLVRDKLAQYNGEAPNSRAIDVAEPSRSQTLAMLITGEGQFPTTGTALYLANKTRLALAVTIDGEKVKFVAADGFVSELLLAGKTAAVEFGQTGAATSRVIVITAYLLRDNKAIEVAKVTREENVVRGQIRPIGLDVDYQLLVSSR